MSSSSLHITAEIMADLAEDRGAPEIDLAHVSSCENCAAALAELRAVITLMRSDQSETAPDQVLTTATNIFAPGDRLAPALRHIVAILTFDSFNATPAFGFRSGQTTSRQLIYSAQEADLDLRVNVDDERCVIAGQILRDTCVGGEVEIFGSAGSAKAKLNELCEFTLPPIERGQYSLRLRMADIEVEVRELDLRS
jgi:hypothetical protein